MAECLQADQQYVFSVVGDHPDDPNVILLRGEDKLLYQLDLRDGLLRPAEFADLRLLDLRPAS
jgi:hypothetical protein